MTDKKGHSPSSPEKVRKKTVVVHAIYEGGTECGYFDHLKNVNLGKKKNPIYVEFREISKTFMALEPNNQMDYRSTLRSDMIEIAYAYKGLGDIPRHFTTFAYVTLYLENIWALARKQVKDENKSQEISAGCNSFVNYVDEWRKDIHGLSRLEAAKDIFSKLRMELIDYLLCECKPGSICSKQYVSKMLDNNDGVREIKQLLGFKGNTIIGNYMPDITSGGVVSVVIDRDYNKGWCDKIERLRKDGKIRFESRSDEEYLKHLYRCNEYGIELLLSNPSFEIWLLMHHSQVDSNSNLLLSSQKELDNQLLKLENRNETGHEYVDGDQFKIFYKSNVKTAINRSRKVLNRSSGIECDFVSEEEMLKCLVDEHNCGTNIGIFLESLIRE